MRFLLLLAAAALLSPVPRAIAQANAALGRPITASGPLWPGFPVTNLTDGQLTTFTHPQAASGTAGFRYELNLQTSRTINSIRIYNRHDCCPERLSNYRISVHPDNGSGAPGTAVWSAVIRANGTNSGMGGMDEVFASAHPAGTFAGQWIRLENVSNAAYNPQLAEIQVWTDDIAIPNVALGKPVTATATPGAGTASALTDGNLLNFAHPPSAGTSSFHWQIDLLRTYPLDRIVIYQRADCCPERLRNYRVSLHEDVNGSPGPAVWSADVRKDGTFADPGSADTVRAADGTGTPTGRFLRILNSSGDPFNPQIAEVEAYRAPVPRIARFEPDAGNITATGNPSLPSSATLTWSVEGATTVQLDPDGSPQPVMGSLRVQPATTTTYTLTATNASGTSTATVTIAVDAPTLPVRINEFLADSAGSFPDEDGENPDWIEFFNPNPYTASLTGHGLSDNPGNPRKWIFPATTIPPNGFLTVFASGKNRPDNPGRLHTNFSLARSGESLTLSAPDGTVIDRVPADWPTTPTYPEQSTETGYGRNAAGAWRYFRPATPNAANQGEGFAGVVADTRFLPRRGVFAEPQSVTISCDTPNAVIRYTTNGTEPTESTGTVYTGPIAVSSSTVIRAAAFAPGLAPTNTDTHSYLFPDNVASQTTMLPVVTNNATWGPQIPAGLRDLPMMSLTTANPSAINNDTEVAAHIEWLDQATGTTAAAGTGVSWFGGAFTNFAKKSFRLYFRDRYGAPRFQAPLFRGSDHGTAAAESFDSLELRNGSHDMKDRGFYMSNLFTDQTMLEMGHVSPHGRMVHLFINGTYWGMYHLRERWNAAMLADYLGGEKESYEAINGNYNVGGWPTPGQAYDGTGAAWERAKAQRLSFTNSKSLIEVTNYIDYMITWMFGNSEDEYRCAGHTSPGSGFRFLMNDADGWLSINASNQIAAWDGSDNNTARASTLVNGVFNAGRSPGDGPGAIFAGLFLAADPEYRILLADRIHRHLGPNGALSAARNTARLNAMCSAVQRAFIPEAGRWNYRLPDNWNGAWTVCRNSWIPNRTNTVLSQFRSAGLFPTTNPPAFQQHGGTFNPGFTLAISGPSGATIFCTTDGTDPRLPGGSAAPSAITYTSPLNLTGRSLVRARSRSSTGAWSALTEAFFVPAGAAAVPAGALTISELMFHPSTGSTGQFLELLNASPTEFINLRGCRFADGIRFQFSPWRDTILAPGQRLVLAASEPDFLRLYPSRPRPDGIFLDSLANGGESLSLVNPDGSPLVQMTWSDQWSPLADGGGHSLVQINPTAGNDPGNPANWRPSAVPGGSPGSSDSGPGFSGDPLADADGDGLTALMEYALGLSDSTPSHGLPLVIESTQPLRFRFARAAAADDARLTAQSASSPAGPWSSTDAAFRIVSESLLPDGRVSVTMEAIATPPDSQSAFLRLSAALR